KGCELPSITGISGASTSIKRLSMPKPAKAADKCSMVETRTPSSLTKAVHSMVSLTNAASALMSTVGVRSVRRNTIPVFAGAGTKVICTLCPECKPIPVACTVFFNVRCLIIKYPPVTYPPKWPDLNQVQLGFNASIIMVCRQFRLLFNQPAYAKRQEYLSNPCQF